MAFHAYMGMQNFVSNAVSVILHSFISASVSVGNGRAKAISSSEYLQLFSYLQLCE